MTHKPESKISIGNNMNMCLYGKDKLRLNYVILTSYNVVYGFGDNIPAYFLCKINSQICCIRKEVMRVSLQLGF